MKVSGRSITVAEGSNGFTVFEDTDIVAMWRHGVATDLSAELLEGDELDPIRLSDPEGLRILRHSTAHVLAQAVQTLNSTAKLGIGPPITDGFYYDFLVSENFRPEDLSALETEMRRIVKANQRFVRVEVSQAEAQAAMAAEPLKLELLSQKGISDESAAVEIGGENISIYENRNREGEMVWRDLCRGPHLPSTRYIGKGFALTRVSAAYWLGNQKNQQLQRIYGTAWPTTEDLELYRERLAEAARRDHRRLGLELDLFSFPDEIGSGLAVFHPKGGIVRREMEDYSRHRHEAAGYEFVYSPHITKSNLFESSGHLAWYADGMFPPMKLDAEVDAQGTVTRAGADYYLKPMNCPFHILIFRSRARSYRELPLRLFEFGTVYRYEKSGVIHGLTRVRGLTQDDAHLFVSREQLEDELSSVLDFVLSLLRDYGLTDFYLELSTRDDSNDKFVGSETDWKSATETLERVARSSGLELVADPGGAAFYGPKISVQTKDAIGRSWQMSTIQLDFNLPERFDLQYTGPDGDRHRPLMIHRALFGSIERFFGVLTEHYAGAFPPWLAPVQVVGIPISSEQNEYLGEFIGKLKQAGVRAELDAGDDRMQKKIRDHTLQKVPFLVLAGGRDAAAATVSFRYRDGSQENDIPALAALDRIREAISARVQI